MQDTMLPTRQGWNSDLSNIDALKATKEDLERRKQKTKVKNIDLVRASMKWKKKEAKLLKKRNSPFSYTTWAHVFETTFKVASSVKLFAAANTVMNSCWHLPFSEGIVEYV